MKKEIEKSVFRNTKPRENGLTMMMDKGLSIRQAEDFISTNEKYTDIIKLGFGTSLITPNVSKKIKLYKDCNIDVFAGGTLFEAFAIREKINDYKKYLNKINLEMVEISDGTINLTNEKKCEIIEDFAKDFKVISEVGNKEQSLTGNTDNWGIWMRNELSAGSWKVIAEARESGNVGIFNSKGSVQSELVKKIIEFVSIEDIIWEAPLKNQQSWLINTFGSNVNLGNIAPNDVISLECLRLGLRSDTFFNFLK